MPTLSPLQLLIGDARETLKTLPDASVHCVVTSPPYWGLRDYGTATWEGGDPACDHRGRSQTSNASTLGEWKNGGGQRYKEEAGGMPFSGTCGKCGAQRIDAQIGLEKTPEEYVANMVSVFREVRRVLRSDGTLWLNLGDSFWTDSPVRSASAENFSKVWDPSQTASRGGNRRSAAKHGDIKNKDLVGIPWAVAFALRADGWYLRQWMPWVKRNAMPESVGDRPVTSCETFFLLTKSPNYFYDGEAVKMRVTESSIGRLEQDISGQTGSARANGGRKTNGNIKAVGDIASGRSRRNGDWFFDSDWQGMLTDDDGWPVAMVVNPQPYAEAHFATFPPRLVQPCILAGTSAMGCCPACGAPWERVIEEGEPDIEHQKACGGDENGAYDGQSTKDYAQGGAQDASATKARILAGMKKRTTTRWEATCKCGLDQGENVPCTVLDPFLGSGTTAKVAIEHGRLAIGCELNPEYGKLIEQRTSTTMGLGL